LPDFALLKFDTCFSFFLRLGVDFAHQEFLLALELLRSPNVPGRGFRQPARLHRAPLIFVAAIAEGALCRESSTSANVSATPSVASHV